MVSKKSVFYQTAGLSHGTVEVTKMLRTTTWPFNANATLPIYKCQNVGILTLPSLELGPAFVRQLEDLKQEKQVGQRKFSRFYEKYRITQMLDTHVSESFLFCKYSWQGFKLWAFMFLFTGCVYVLPPGARPREDARYTMSLLGNSLHSNPLIILSSGRFEMHPNANLC